MKKRRPQSQRKNIPKSLYQGNILKKNTKTSKMSTFRQTKDIKLLPNQSLKKNLNKSHKQSPKTIDYLQVMNKYSHLMDQNLRNTFKKKQNKITKYNGFYTNTDYNKERNKDLGNIFPFRSSNNISNNNNFIFNDDFFQFCQTDYENNEKEEDKNNFKYFTLKDFYLKKKNSSEVYNNFTTNNYNRNNNNCNNIPIKNKDNEIDIEENKINKILMSYDRNNKVKNRENIYGEEKIKNLYNNNTNSVGNNFQSNKNNNNKIFNNNIHKNISQKKISKKNNSANSHSLNNINKNSSNKYFYMSNTDVNNNLDNISSSNEELNQKNKIQEKNNKTLNYDIFSEKIISFINLCQKYANLLSNSTNNLELNRNSISNNNDNLDELKYIINQYNQFIFSDKLNKYFNMDINVNANLNSKNNNGSKAIKNIKLTSNFNLREFEPKTLNLTEKFRNKIENLKTEKNEMNNELILFKKKNRNLILEKEELNLANQKLMKENEELNRKYKNMINLENKYYHQNNMIDKLKCQIETLNIDIKYKENIINNLQQILEQIKIKSNLINYNNNTNDSDNIKINQNKNTNNNLTINNKKQGLIDLGNEYIIKGINKESDFLLDVNSESIEKDIILPLNLKVNSFEDSKDQELFFNKKENDSEIIINNKEERQKNILQLKKNLNPNNNNSNLKNKLLFSENDEPEILTKEMEKIDQDILNLKTKLKRIIAK